MFHKIFCNNVLIRFISTVVKFCNDLYGINNNSLKFSENVPLKHEEVNKKISFQSITGDEIDCNNVKTC